MLNSDTSQNYQEQYKEFDVSSICLKAELTFRDYIVWTHQL